MGLVVTFALGVFVLFGALVAGLAKNGHRIREISIAVALGAMAMLLADDLIPEAVEISESLGWPLVAGGIAAGVLILVFLDKFLPESHHGEEHVDVEESAFHISIATTIALVVHNVVEGMSVYSLAAQSLAMAVVLAIGVGLHNVPMGMIVYSGLRDESTKHKVVVMGFAALSTFVGGLAMFALSNAVDETLVSVMICLTIGLLCYIIFFELIPHVLHSTNKRITVISIFVGVAAVAMSGVLEGLV